MMAHTRYSAEVFDVLQTYHGLPVFERLIENPANTAVVKMMLATEDGPAPQTDPPTSNLSTSATCPYAAFVGHSAVALAAGTR